jgi:transposase
MKIIHPICCGADVHKDTIVATIATTKNGSTTTYEQRQFSTLNPDLYAFRDWLDARGCKDVCMESTGKYWIPPFNILEKTSTVVLVHPKYVRAIKGKKTDKRDSKWIANLFKHDLVKGSFIPPLNIRQCREIARYRSKLVGMRASEKNRYQNCMTISNIGLGSVLTDTFGKTSQGIMDYLLQSDEIDEEYCKSLIKGTARKKTATIIDSVRGCKIESDQRFKLTQAKSHMDYLDERIGFCEMELFTRSQPHYKLVELLSTLPGITELSAALILSEIGTDMGVFESAAQLTSWAGLVPGNNESAGKKKSVRITKAGQYLKPLLVQCALSAIKVKDEAYFRIKYQRIKKRRGHKRALVAIARMMLVCIYHMVKNGEHFNPSDYEELKDPKPKASALTEEAALAFLKNKGYDVSKLVTV